MSREPTTPRDPDSLDGWQCLTVSHLPTPSAVSNPALGLRITLVCLGLQRAIIQGSKRCLLVTVSGSAVTTFNAPF